MDLLTPRSDAVIQSPEVGRMRVAYALLAIAAVAAVGLILAWNSSTGLADPMLDSSTSTPTPPEAFFEGEAVVEVIMLPNAQEGDEPDVLLMALLTVGVAAGAGVLALIGYVFRKRIGFEPHRPPPREGGAPEEHH